MKIKMSLLRACASLLSLVAVGGITVNSMWIFYQPDVPKALQK